MGSRVVPVPAYTDPHNPKAAAGSINFGVAGNFPGVDKHPVEHAPDYGAKLGVVPSAESEENLVPENRDEWTKPQWVALAEEYGLSKSGSTDDIIKRVERHEAQLEAEKEGE